jgi:hypothetical protein
MTTNLKDTSLARFSPQLEEESGVEVRACLQSFRERSGAGVAGRGVVLSSVHDVNGSMAAIVAKPLPNLLGDFFNQIHSEIISLDECHSGISFSFAYSCNIPIVATMPAAVVTGASSAIGQCFAQLLTKEVWFDIVSNEINRGTSYTLLRVTQQKSMLARE